MISPKIVWRSVIRGGRCCARNWPGVVGVLSLIVGLVGLCFEKCPSQPRQQVSYRVSRPVEVFDMEVCNTGTIPLWYDSPSDRPDKAASFYIEIMPRVRVLDAWVVAGNVDENGFELLEDDEWKQGHVGFKWRVLPSGESVVIRVVHEKAGKPLVIRLTGELKESLVPRKLEPRKILTARERVFLTMALLGVIWIVVYLLAWLLWIAWKKQHRDREMSESLAIPEGVVPSLLVYWRHEVVRRLRLVERLTRVTVCVIIESYAFISREENSFKGTVRWS